MSGNVCDVLVEALTRAGVRQVFGIPGDAINGLLESIRKQDTLRFIQVRHEESGAFAASAQAKLSGELAACVGTAGPGALHLLNGLYDAKSNHAPVIAITGQVAMSELGTDAFQEIDLDAVFADVAAYSQIIGSPDQAHAVATRAIQTARAQRAVAHITLPQDIAFETATGEFGSLEFVDPQTRPRDEDLERAAELLNDAERVVVMLGKGAEEARDELLACADTLGAPIIKALRGKHVVSDDHPACLGGLGLLGTKPSVEAAEACDALLLVGTDFPYPDFLPSGARTVQIDLEPRHFAKRTPVEVVLRGHARPTLEALAPRLSRKDDRSYLERAQKSMRQWREKLSRAETSDDVPIRPQRVAAAVGRLARDDAVFVCDTGAVTVWGARNLTTRGDQRFTLSGGLASMAYGLPGAIGAQLRYPSRQVVALVGDGGFSMLMADFLTAVRYELPITVVVFNNRKLGLIQMEQEVQGLPEFETQLQDMDFGAFARLCGGEGRRIEDPAELDNALSEALDSPRPWVLDVLVNPNERTMPPTVSLKNAIGYGAAKLKEMIGLGDAPGVLAGGTR